MKFWQAVVTGQLAAGAVWADKFPHLSWSHELAEAGSIVVGAVLWFGWKWAFERPTPAPSDSLHTGEVG